MKNKGIIINYIINKLNMEIDKENEKLCAKNVYWEQKPHHGFDMYIKLAYMSDEALEKVAEACKL